MDRKPLTASELRHNRLRLGWSRDQLGHQIGVDADTIALWEQGSLEISCPIVLEQVFRRHDELERGGESSPFRSRVQLHRDRRAS